MWMKPKSRSYTAEHIPHVSDVRAYRNDWIAWWTLCQPAWRKKNGWPLPRDNAGSTDWVKLGARGQNGLFLVVMSTTWWAFSVQSEKEWAEFNKAVDDIQWVIDQVTDSLKALPAPAPPAPAPSKTSQKPKTSLGTALITRGEGKRQPKPTRRLLEAEQF